MIMETPTFTAAIDAFRKRGARVVTVPVDEEGMRTDRLIPLCEALKPKLIYTIPNHHNPTGAVLSRSRRLELLSVARAFDCIVLEDDPWGELSFGAAPPPAVKSLDADGHVIAGSLDDAVEAVDIWSFSRNVESAGPDWLLDETDEG